MSLTVTQRPRNPNTSLDVINGSFTDSLSPWVNFNTEAAGWSFSGGTAEVEVTGSNNSRILRQQFIAKSGLTYNFSFDLTLDSSSSSFNFVMRFRGSSGTQVISLVSLPDVDDPITRSGSVVANNDYEWVEFQITFNAP